MIAPATEEPFADRFGGSAGQHARAARWWTPVRIVLAVLTIAFGLSLVHNAPCVATNWSDSKLRSAAMCYSDVPYLYTGRGFVEQQWPYAATDRYDRMEYPVGVAYFAWGVSELTALAPRGPAASVRAATPANQQWSLEGISAETNQYFILTAALLFACALAAAWFIAMTDRRRPWNGLLFALSPALLSTALINWDLLAVMAVAAAIWAWQRDRLLLTGVLIGIGSATKLYPVLLLGAVVVLAIRDRRLVRFAPVLVGAAAAWVAAQVPAWLFGSWQAWTYFWSFNSHRGADLGSLWLLAQHLGLTWSTGAINSAMWVLLGGACLGILALGLISPRRPTFAELGFLVVLAFTLVNKVYSPQYVLWLLPLAILARPRWRDLLIWQACELLYFAAVWWYIADFLELSRGGQDAAYDIAIVIRVVGELFLAAMVIRGLGRRSADLDDVERRGSVAHAG